MLSLMGTFTRNCVKNLPDMLYLSMPQYSLYTQVLKDDHHSCGTKVLIDRVASHT